MSTQPKANSTLHAGHRARLKKRFQNDYGESMETHELLELLLFYVVPRADTNMTAHALLERFGSLCAVLDAPVEDLISVKGVGIEVAAYLKMIGATMRRAELEQMDDGKRFHTVQDIKDYIKPLFSHLNCERLYMLSFDDAKRLISCDKIAQGSTNAVAVNTNHMVRIAVMGQASWVVLAHNHPRGVALPSLDDISATGRYREILQSVSIQLVEHYIVGDGEIVPIIHDNTSP